MSETMTLPSTLDERLQRVEDRIRALADAIGEAAGSAEPSAPLDDLLRTLGVLTEQMRRREHEREWDSVDHLTARLMLKTLTAIAGTLRAQLADADATLTDAAHAMRRAHGALGTLERELHSHGSAEQPE